MFNSAVGKWQHILQVWQFGTVFFRLEIIASLVVCLCTIITMFAIINSFLNGKRHESVNYEKKSVVETGTMTLFFLLYYGLVQNKMGVILWKDSILSLACVLVGMLLVVIGCVVNIVGRLNLGSNWGNQIRIYHDHSIITDGVYKWIRHPLYASLIWMFYGASLVYANVAAFAANTLIFLPFMYYRAKQEEEMLQQKFPDYAAYRKKTGMFFPSRIWQGENHV